MKNEDIEFAFAIVAEAIKEGHPFTNDQKDLCVVATLDALAPAERPWFYEVANMLKLPLWQVLWGQWRRNQENGMAQAPVLDPGWEGERGYSYGLEEKACPICSHVFKPTAQGQIYCSNRCGTEAERRAMPAFEPPPLPESPADSVDLGTDTVPMPDPDPFMGGGGDFGGGGASGSW